MGTTVKPVEGNFITGIPTAVLTVSAGVAKDLVASGAFVEGGKETEESVALGESAEEYFKSVQAAGKEQAAAMEQAAAEAAPSRPEEVPGVSKMVVDTTTPPASGKEQKE